jgi:trans-aconitate 2-methyltransferase
VVDWVSGTSLTRFKRQLPADVYARLMRRYEERLVEVLGDRQPYFFPFKRLLIWARRRG